MKPKPLDPNKRYHIKHSKGFDDGTDYLEWDGERLLAYRKDGSSIPVSDHISFAFAARSVSDGSWIAKEIK